MVTAAVRWAILAVMSKIASGSLKTASTDNIDRPIQYFYEVPVQYRYLVQYLDWSVYVVR